VWMWGPLMRLRRDAAMLERMNAAETFRVT
jgi:hypothetical protein